MIAICPVGPPKLMKPSSSQKRNASAKLTFIPWPDARPPSGERRRRVSEEALLARELILQYGERALDPRQRGRHHRFVGGNAELRKYHALVHQIEHDVGVVVGAQAADPLVHLRALARFDRLQARTGEC